MVLDVFEEYAEDYDRWFDEHRDEYLEEMARLREFVPSPDDRSIEVGAGSGRFAAPLGVPLGLEPARALARIARQRGLEVIRGVAEALPLKNGVCSLVLLVTVICYLVDPRPAFLEIRRALRPSGSLVVAFIERGGLIHRKYLQEKVKGRFLSRARFYSTREVETLLLETGFRIVRIDSRAGFCIICAEKVEPGDL